jgi:predicted porin
MTKSLIALAALSAFSTSAHAQSSVTIYGILDYGYKSSDLKLTAGEDGVSLKSRDLAVSNQQTSRWGIRGTEDLGGGLRAGFQLEAGMSLDSSGATAGTDTAVAAVNTLGSRPTFVSLSSTNLGEVRAGRQDTSLHASVLRFNTGGGNNMPGSIYSTFGTAIFVDNAGGDADLDLNNYVNETGLGRYATTVDKVITYTTPVINGFQAQITVGDGKDSVSANDGAVGVSGSEKRKTEGFNVAYAAGKFDIGYGYNRSKTTGALTVSTTSIAGTSAKAETTASNLGASYDFGVARLFVQHLTLKSETATATAFDNKATEVGFRVPMGKTLLWASYVDGERKLATDNSRDFDQKGYQLGASYSLSKRSNLYAIYGDQELKGKGSASNLKLAEEAIALGIRHTF